MSEQPRALPASMEVRRRQRAEAQACRDISTEALESGRRPHLAPDYATVVEWISAYRDLDHDAFKHIDPPGLARFLMDKLAQL
ncbi:hypothetical protein CMI37_20445 [Candidatus Pacearchaeota archaeon]|nr:hypothetical protein [Candidatus Pacearchaeota archaeon]